MKSLIIAFSLFAGAAIVRIVYDVVELVVVPPHECFFPAQALNEEKTMFAIDGKVQCEGDLE